MYYPYLISSPLFCLTFLLLLSHREDRVSSDWVSSDSASDCDARDLGYEQQQTKPWSPRGLSVCACACVSYLLEVCVCVSLSCLAEACFTVMLQLNTSLQHNTCARTHAHQHTQPHTHPSHEHAARLMVLSEHVLRMKMFRV
jgi:hypothetical protein